MEKPPGYLSKKKMTGQGVSKNILDRAVWRDEHGQDDAWVAALDKLDRRGDKTALTELLRSHTALPNSVRYYLADLIERGVAKPKGRPRTPAYAKSNVEAVLFLANIAVSEYINERGLTVDEALVKAVERYGIGGIITIDTLRNYHAGRRGLSNRKRGPP